MTFRSGDGYRERRKLRCRPTSVSIILAVLLSAQKVVLSFPVSPRNPPSRRSADPVSRGTANGGVVVRDRNIDALCSFAGRGGRRRCRKPYHLSLKTKSTIEEEFQRSLLGERIANDITATTVKEENERIEVVANQIVQEKEKLQEAVKEVKDAVQNISQSTVNLVISNSTEGNSTTVQEWSQSAMNVGVAFIKKGPKIFTRLFSLMARSEIRWVQVSFVLGD